MYFLLFFSFISSFFVFNQQISSFHPQQSAMGRGTAKSKFPHNSCLSWKLEALLWAVG